MTAPRSYRLGIDLGTTYTAAAVSRRSGTEWSEPEIVALGSRTAAVASVLHLSASGEVLVGEAAERRAHTEPDRVVRQFKRRIGDDVPLVVGDGVFTAQALAARLARWVVDRVAEREGGPADAVAVTHPASWGEHKRELLAVALRDAGVTGTTFLSEPQAAAVAYAAKERVEVDSPVAVYDLGGGTFDAAVVRRTAAGFELPGRAEGIETLGGVDFDDRVVDHVRAGIGAAFDELDTEDPDVRSALRRLRLECVEAKEALSADTEVTIPVMLPELRTDVRLTRREFEAMIRSSLDHTVNALTRTVESAGLTAGDLQAVLLVGGSSRIPLVAQMVSEAVGRPVAVDADPKTSIAVGAVLAVAPRTAAPRPAVRAVAAGPDAAASAAATSAVAWGASASQSGPSSGLLDLRSAASAATARAATPARTPTPARTGPSSGPFPRLPSGPRPARTEGSTGPGSGRPPVAPTHRTGLGSGYFPSPNGGLGPTSAAFRSPAADDRTTLTPGGRTPPRPPVAPAAPEEPWAQPEPETPRSRTRLVVMVAAAVVLVGALTTGGVVYARSASVSATVAPPTSASVPAPPAPVAPEPTDVAVSDPPSGTGGGTGGAGSGSGTRGGSSSGGSSRGGTGSSSHGSSGTHHGSGTTTEPTSPWPEPTPEPSPPTDEAGNG